MSHRYGLPIPVEADPASGLPLALRWHSRRYRVRAIYSTWHLVDRWWAAGNPTDERGHGDRTYYRVECDDFFIADVYHDTGQNCWVLDVIHD